MPRYRHDYVSFCFLFRTLNYGLWESPRSGPVYVDDGAKCGENKACLDMDCLDKDEVYANLVSASIKKMRLEQNDYHSADVLFKCIFLL